MLWGEVEAATPDGQMPPVISLLLGARDSLGQELMLTTVSFELLLAYDFDFDADGVLDDEDAGSLFLWLNNRRPAALRSPAILLRPAIRTPVTGYLLIWRLPWLSGRSGHW